MPGIEAVEVLCGHETDVGKVFWWKKKFPLYIRIEHQGTCVRTSVSLSIGAIPR